MGARRDGAIDRILGTTPVAVLVDRSRDAFAGASLVYLRPDDVFRTTDSRVRLTANRLAGYDILAICSNGTMPYSAAEKKAVRTFVRRGGSLLLAAGSGVGGGLICMSSNSVHSGVKPENYLAMVRTIREFGRYPLSFV